MVFTNHLFDNEGGATVKRFVALFVLVGILMTGILSVSAAEEPIKSDIAGLRAHQDLLDEIQANLAYMETSYGLQSANVNYADLLSQISSIDDGQPEQIYETAGRITISGGIHYIDEACDIESITLLNNAVLFNFSGYIQSLSLKDDAAYFGTSKSQAATVVLERHGMAYLQDVSGERLTAGGNAEVFMFDGTAFPVLYSLEEANVAIASNTALISRGYVGKAATLFDPNARVAQVEWEEGREDASASTSGGRSGGKKAADTPYPAHIMQWVFGSTPQSDYADAPPACLCGCNCKNKCSHISRCCEKCRCVIIN